VCLALHPSSDHHFFIKMQFDERLRAFDESCHVFHVFYQDSESMKESVTMFVAYSDGASNDFSDNDSFLGYVKCSRNKFFSNCCGCNDATKIASAITSRSIDLTHHVRVN